MDAAMSNIGGRWIWDEASQSVLEADEYWRRKSEKGSAPTVMPDIKAFISPLDGKEVGSRSALREHEKKHNVVQIGNDLKQRDYDVAQKRQNPLNERALENAYRQTVQEVQF